MRTEDSILSLKGDLQGYPSSQPSSLGQPSPRSVGAAAETVTDYWWAKEEAAKAGNLDETLHAWRARRKKVASAEWNPVLRTFQNSRQTVLYRLAPSDVYSVAKSEEPGEHALGEIDSDDMDEPHNKFAANVSPAYAVVLLLHNLLEDMGRVPMWSDFEDYLFENQHLCLRYFLKAGRIPSPKSRAELWAAPRMDAVRWRIGNFFYSFLKEIHIISTLRQTHGLDVRYHPLLDAEWKADFVCGDVRGELFYSNDRYKAATSGRKSPCQKLNPGLPVVTMLVNRPDGFGHCWLYKDDVIAKLASRIRELGGPSIPSFNERE